MTKRTAARATGDSKKNSVNSGAESLPPEIEAADSNEGGIEDRASRSTLAVNPLIGLRIEDISKAATTLLGAAIREPMIAARHFGAYTQELMRVAMGSSEIEADPKDKRFADPAWKASGLHKRLLKAYVAANKEVNSFIDDSDLSARDKERVRVVASIYLDTIAPSNTLLNPSAMKHAVDTGGMSLVDGLRNLAHDVQYNRGLPSSVDKSAFEIGRNLCTTPGSVVFKNEVLELIQYECSSDTVWKRPLVVCPPQVNKFYSIDLSPEKSFARFAAAQGIQMFAVSWRNPTVEQRDWSMSTYAKALDQAVDAACEITGSDKANMWGACSGGMTMASYLAYLAGTENRKIASVVAPVCVLDATAAQDTTMGLFMTPESLKAIRLGVQQKGFVEGSEMARVFAWLRPNDLIWNYWVNNYLHGKKPPAFDVLYWNADTTRLPAAFHGDLLTILEKSPFTQPNVVKVCGVPVDMSKVEVDAYVVAGITDHITPWKACYETARIFGPKSTFVLANAGHLQSILNPPGAPKSFFFSGPASAETPDEWATTAPRQDGSWWPHFAEWISTRSGERVSRPEELGSTINKPSVAAPGEYVLEQ